MSLLKVCSSQEILDWRKQQLAIGGRDVDIDWLLDVGGGIGWGSLQKIKVFNNSFHHLERSLEDLSLLWVEHVKNSMPLQYLLGKCPWRDFELEVNSSVLIPRQETEILFELTLQKIKSGGKTSGIWTDLGTGSGALAIALARSLPNWTGHAVDVSEKALAIAKRNINRLQPNAKVSLHLGNWWEPLNSYAGEIDIAVANPPYIPKKVLAKLDPIVRENEPYIALCGGGDGMDEWRQIVKGAFVGIRPGGWLFFEHHYDQSHMALEYLKQCGFIETSFEYDLSGVKRFAYGMRP